MHELMVLRDFQSSFTSHSHQNLLLPRLPPKLAQQVKNLPAMRETQEMRIWSLSRGDPLEKETATHSSILAWKIPWTEKPGGLQSKGLQRIGHNWATQHTHRVSNLSITLRVWNAWLSFHQSCCKAIQFPALVSNAVIGLARSFVQINCML